MPKYDLLVYLALGIVILAIVASALTLWLTPETTDIEARKIHFAAATLTGILVMFIFTAALYFDDQTGKGKEIFDRSLPAILSLAGVIIGHFFTKK